MRTSLSTVAIFVLSLSSSLLAAPSSVDDINERLQRQQLEQQQRRLDDIRLPGASPSVPSAPQHKAESPCFPVRRIELEDFTAPSVLSGRIRARLRIERECYRIGDIQALQRHLTDYLVKKGYVTSRVLLPEQNLSSGVLRFVLVSGRITGVDVDAPYAHQVNTALPQRRDALLNLRDLEQAIENLERVPGQSANIDLKPSKEQGGSILQASVVRPSSVAGSLAVTDKHYGEDDHAVAAASVETGGLWGMADRIRLSANQDLDDRISDKAWGLTLDYDLGIGYWLFTLNAGRQAYINFITPALQTFDASGKTDSAQFSVSRVLMRSNTARLTAGGYIGYQDIGNFFEGARIHVSSYRLNRVGLSVDAMKLWRRYQFSTSLSAEQIWAGGAATNLPGGVSIAAKKADRYNLSAAASRRLPWWNSSVQVRVNSQFAYEQLFPVSQFSLTALVQGYEDVSLAGNSGTTVSLQYSQVHPFFNGHLSVRPYAGAQVGWVPGNSNEAGFNRLAASSLGASANYDHLGLTLDCAWPWDSQSTIQSGNEYVLRSTLSYRF